MGGIGFYYFASQKALIKNSPDNKTGSTLLTTPPESSPSVATEEAMVQYIKREKILETVKIPRSTAMGTDATEDFDIYL